MSEEARDPWFGWKAVRWVIDEAPVPADLAFTLVVIARRADKDGCGSFQSVATIAEKTGLSEKQARRNVARLRELGLIVLGDQALAGKLLPAGQRPVVYDVVMSRVGAKPSKESRNPSGLKHETPPMHGTPPTDGSPPFQGESTPPMDGWGTPPFQGSRSDHLEVPREEHSLSALLDDIDQAIGGAVQPEREASLQDSNAEKRHPNAVPRRWLARCDVPTAEADLLAPVIVEINDVQGAGWWATVHRNGDLPDLIEVARDILAARTDAPESARVPECGECDNRFVENSAGRWEYCPRCHPNRKRAASPLRGWNADL